MNSPFGLCFLLELAETATNLHVIGHLPINTFCLNLLKRQKNIGKAEAGFF
jgi:hypothetical protein